MTTHGIGSTPNPVWRLRVHNSPSGFGIMKILLDAHMVGEEESGNETYVANLIRHLQALGLPGSFLLATAHPKALAKIIMLDDQFRSVSVSTSSIRRVFYDLPRIAARERVDVMHVTYAGPPYGHCPLIVSIHDISYKEDPKWFSLKDRLVLNAGVSATLRRAASVITLSEYSKSRIMQSYAVPARRVMAVPLAADANFRPIDDTQTIDEKLTRYGIRKPYVLAVGNLQPRKNLSALIQAFALLTSRGKFPCQLVIVGKHRWRGSEVQASVESLNLVGTVVVTGYVPTADLPFLYAGADLLAYPSLYEGFGLPILEAMACGTPVVTSNVTSMPEVAGDAAILVDPTSVEDIAQGLERVLLDESLRRELSRKGLARASEFSWKKTAQLTYDIYCRVVEMNK